MTDLSLKVGDERTIEATTVPKDSKVTWTTDKEAVARVDNAGKVTAVSEGTAVITGTITAGEQELSEKCTVTVSKDTPQPEDIGITLSLSETFITQGMEKALKATTKPEGKAVTWSSSDSNIASVDGNGIVKGLKPGTVIITATITVDGKEYSATCKVTVVPVGFIPKGSSNEGHVRKFIWDTVEATEDADGELRYQCEICGMIKERVPLTAYNVFNKNTTEKVRKAKKDATVKIDTRKWISFHKMVMEALAERPDVTLEVTFLDGEYKGNKCTVTIPKGIDDMSLVDKNGFTGFLYLGGKFGMKTNPN
ncbi:MAG: Ig-like domain-containing protein [Butyrivibrio sp.]|nr:Ig-like domain-containing protein [Butyrivibrio sp.]